MDFGSIISIIASMMGGLGGSSGSNTSGQSTQQRLLMEDLLNQQRQRMMLQNPLYEEVQQLTRALLPKSAKPTSYQLPGGVTPAPTPDPYTPNNPSPDPNAPAPQVMRPGGTTPVSQAIQMLSSGIRPMNQASLFRR